MKTYFIRHKIKQDNHNEDQQRNVNRIKLLSENKAIGLFYDNEPWHIISEGQYWLDHPDSKNSKYFQTYRSSMNFFKRISAEGGQVFCEYENAILSNGKKGCYFGIIKPNTPVTESCDLNVTLKLQNVMEVSYSDFPIILAIRPPYGTMCEPQRETFSLIANILLGEEEFTPSRNLIHPNVAEQMCVEYLRIFGLPNSAEEKLDYLFLSVGKTMAAIDIAGRLTKSGKKIYAQVKNGDIGDGSHEEFLKIVGPNDIGVIFSTNKENQIKENIYYISIDTVFNKLRETNPQMIDDMIGIKLRK